MVGGNEDWNSQPPINFRTDNVRLVAGSIRQSRVNSECLSIDCEAHWRASPLLHRKISGQAFLVIFYYTFCCLLPENMLSLPPTSTSLTQKYMLFYSIDIHYRRYATICIKGHPIVPTDVH